MNTSFESVPWKFFPRTKRDDLSGIVVDSADNGAPWQLQRIKNWKTNLKIEFSTNLPGRPIGQIHVDVWCAHIPTGSTAFCITSTYTRQRARRHKIIINKNNQQRRECTRRLLCWTTDSVCFSCNERVLPVINPSWRDDAGLDWFENVSPTIYRWKRAHSAYVRAEQSDGRTDGRT